ncbi:MAG: hypothetical protein KME50_36105 [Nostoc desertorum CM1-VF14]|jgi:hypothetical protein|nr:hypothetical protein [Nostoc desertorum CM1-VF14]
MQDVLKIFHAAIFTLVTGDYSLRKRLFYAYCNNLAYLKYDEIPEEIKFDFRQLSTDLMRCKIETNEKTIEATINKIDDNEVWHMAFKILRMYNTLQQVEQIYSTSACYKVRTQP